MIVKILEEILPLILSVDRKTQALATRVRYVALIECIILQGLFCTDDSGSQLAGVHYASMYMFRCPIYIHRGIL